MEFFNTLPDEIQNEATSCLGNNQTLYHLLVSNKHFETDGKIIMDYNNNIDFICNKKLSNKYV